MAACATCGRSISVVDRARGRSICRDCAARGERQQLDDRASAIAVDTPDVGSLAHAALRTVRLNGGMEVQVAGEASYRDAITRVSGGPARDGVEFECEATLVPEPDNPYDPNAVRVMIGGELVGYLPRQAAIAYGPVGKTLRDRGEVGKVNALIRGGWNRSLHDRGEFGITLDMAKPANLVP